MVTQMNSNQIDKVDLKCGFLEILLICEVIACIEGLKKRIRFQQKYSKNTIFKSKDVGNQFMRKEICLTHSRFVNISLTNLKKKRLAMHKARTR